MSTLDERVGGDLQIMPYYRRRCHVKRDAAVRRARDVDRGDTRAVGTVRGFTRKRAERQTFPQHLPRERVVIDPPASCECCGGNRLRKLGEDVTQTLECSPRQWKVVEYSSTAATARRSASRRRRSMPWREDGPVPACWP
jgi:hypothetical protein